MFKRAIETASARLRPVIDRVYPHASLLANRIVDIPLTIPLEGEREGYIQYRSEENKIYGRVKGYVGHVRRLIAVDTALQVINPPLDDFDREVYYRDLKQDIGEDTETLRRKIRVITSRKRDSWTLEEESRHIRWVAATTALFLAENVQSTDHPDLKYEVSIAIRRLLIDSVTESNKVDKHLVDEGWVLQTVLPLASKFGLMDDEYVQNVEQLAQYVNDPPKTVA